MAARAVKRPRDTIELAKLIGDIATMQVTDSVTVPDKNPTEVELGRLGGLNDGNAKAQALAAKRQSSIAKKAAQARYSNKKL